MTQAEGLANAKALRQQTWPARMGFWLNQSQLGEREEEEQSERRVCVGGAGFQVMQRFIKVVTFSLALGWKPLECL